MLGVHQVDGRIASNAAVKISAALRESIDPQKIVIGYLHTHPEVSEFISQDRTRARAWAMHNVTLDNEALESALRQHYADMYVTGIASTYDAYGRALRSRKAEKKPTYNWDSVSWATAVLENAINWDAWTPGNFAAEALVKPPGGLEKLLGQVKLTTQTLNKTTYDQIGSRLAEGFSIGASPTTLSTMLKDVIGSPERSLMIALTEGSRAANAAARDAYAALGVDQIQWVASDPDDEECDIDGEITDVDGEFSNGLTAEDIPVHPNCRCSTMAVPPEPSQDSLNEVNAEDQASD
jgi:hypothetical protein